MKKPLTVKKLCFKPIIFFLTFIFSGLTFSQELHHQMLSSQGSNSITDNGIIVTQTIGQQSVIGNYDNQYFKIGQGFQQAKQANWSRIILEQTIPEFEVSIYPNPFNNIVNIQHNSDQDININVFNPAGTLVHKSLINVTSPNQSVNLEELPSGVYLVHLQSNHLKYYTKLIKK
jgi:hypothetical protein|tara:strand:+ start:568 stop:1089 length:522 start_codon:yes stop_codon:yes gene_type:complete